MRWPPGIASAATSCGIKGGDLPDLGVIATDQPCAWAGTFTQNAAAAPPVHWCRAHAGHNVRAIVVNSGNANACTGPEGMAAVQRTARRTAAIIGCDPDEVLIASTGVIGVALPVDLIDAALPSALADLDPDVAPFAGAILTTDTRVKTAAAEVNGATFAGVAKGAAMLAPNMATMLAFLATDAAVAPGDLQSALAHAVDRSFNRISVDACESTNDSVFALTTGRGVDASHATLVRGLTSVCRALALDMVRDAEGGSRVVRIQIEGASDDAHAVELGHAVAASALWRAAVHGADPNWGRIAAALGRHDRNLDLSQLDISIGPERVFERGRPSGSLDAARKVMESTEFDVTCTMGLGKGEAEILTCDLSTQYVVENAWGTT